MAIAYGKSLVNRAKSHRPAYLINQFMGWYPLMVCQGAYSAILWPLPVQKSSCNVKSFASII